MKCPFFSVHKSEDDNCLQQSQANGPNYKVINKVGKLLFLSASTPPVLCTNETLEIAYKMYNEHTFYNNTINKSYSSYTHMSYNLNKVGKRCFRRIKIQIYIYKYD